MYKLDNSFFKLATRRFLAAGAVALALTAFKVCAQTPPPNDNFTNAQVIVGPSGSVTGSNFNATVENGEPTPTDPGIPPDATIWYAWTASFSGTVNFDTVGSTDSSGATLDTVLGVYTGTDLASLAEAASDDDDPNGDLTSRVVFTVQAGQVYYVAVGSYSGTSPGNIVLNWSAGPSAGTFSFSKPTFIVSEYENGGTGVGLDSTVQVQRGAYIAVTRTGGFAGRAQVDILMTPSTYTNRFITNYYGTNVFSTNYSGPNILITNGVITNIVSTSFTNIYQTNLATTNFIANVTRGGTRTLIEDHDFFTVALTNFNTTGGRLIPTAHTCTIPDPNPDPINLTLFYTNQVNASNVIVIVTNFYTYITNVTEVVPSAADGTDFSSADVAKSVVFDDFEMVRLVKLPGIRPGNGPDWPDTNGNFLHLGINRLVNLSLTNAIKDPLEAPEIGVPTSGPDANLVILDFQDHPQRTEGDNCVPYTILNWERKAFTTPDKINGTDHNIVLHVLRSGSLANAATISYAISWLQNPGDFGDNGFELEVGSEYATPNKDFTPVIGTLSWAVNDPFPKSVVIPELSDTDVEFDEDICVVLYMTQAQVTAQPNVIVGYNDTANVTIRYDDMPAGAVDVNFNPDNASASYPPFNPVPGANKPVRALAVQTDGKVVIGGTFTAFDSITNNRVARLLTNGLPDTSFNSGSGANDFVGALALDSSGQAVIGGGFTSFNGTNRYHIARLTGTGALDATFDPGSGANGNISAVAIQPDGKILVGGAFTVFNSTNRARIARLNTDGSLDATFDPGIGPDNNVNAIAIQSTGDVIIGGEFTNVTGAVRRGVARLHSDGTLDTGFVPGSGADGIVNALASLAGDKVLVAGSFKHMDLIDRASIARLNVDGSLDTSFDPGAGANDAIYAMQSQADGTVFIGGVFTSYDQTRRIGIARLLPQGTLDTSFLDTAYNQFAGAINHLYNTNAVSTNATDFPAFSNTRNGIFALGADPSGGLMIGGSFPRLGGGSTRTTTHPRLNVAHLLGGSTPGPGNIVFGQNLFSVDENAGPKGLYVTVIRTNGTLGRAAVNFGINLLQPGPGAILSSDFPTNQALSANPIYQSVWDDWIITPFGSYGWQLSDGYSGPNYRTIPTYLNPRSTAADIFLGVLDNAIVDQNRFAAMSLFYPNGNDIFFLGGDNIPLGVALGRSSSQLEIVDDDYYAGVLGFSATNYPVIENGGFVTVTVSRTNGSTGQVSVQFATANGTALDKKDYSKTNGILTFADSVTSQSFQVKILDNFTAQPDRFFNVVLTSPTGRATLDPTISPSNSVVTIIDNDFGPGHLNFSAATNSVLEGAGSATITVTRTGGNSGTITVQCAVSDGTASNGLDYVASTNTLTWNNNDTSPKTITVPIIQDSQVEGDETVSLRLLNANLVGTPLSDPTNSLILGPQSNSVLVIVDDDFYGVPTLLSKNFNVMENAGQALITVVRVGGVAGTMSVNYTTSDGSAVSPSDYTATTGLLTFGPNETSKTFAVPIRNNQSQDGNRVLNLTLYNPSPAVALVTNGFPKTATLTIIDDESVNNPAGSVDTTETASFDDFVHALALQPDGKILAGGDFTSVNLYPRKRIARLNTDGSVDNAFQLNMAGADGAVRAVISQTPPTNGFINGSIVIAGAFSKVNGVNHRGVARLNQDGSLDETFDPGSGADGPVFALAETFLGASRKYMVGGALVNYNGIYCGGIARLNENGTLDSTFNPGVGITSGNAAVYALAVQANGQIVVGGDFGTFNSLPHRHLVRLNLDGSVDSTFNPDPGAGGSIRAMALQTDGKIVVGGLFINMNGSNYNHIARLNPDGTLDSSFNVGPGVSDTVLALAIDTEGKILVGGEFTTASGVTRNRLTRLNPDGTVDPSINFGLGADNMVEAIAVQPDSSIDIGGGFASFDGVPVQHFARLAGGSISGSGAVEFTSADYGVAENGTNALITVRRRGGTANDQSNSQQVSILFSTSNGTAVAGLDYVGVTNRIYFPLGETFQSVLIPIIDNSIVDGDRTVGLTLSDQQGAQDLGNQTTATLTISNDDTAVAFASDTFREGENVVGGNARISIVRLGSASNPISVDVATVFGGTAQPGVRYVATTNTITFNPGETNKLWLIPLINDTNIEGDQTVSLQMSNSIGGYLASPNVATLTIAEDDSGPGVLTFSQTNYTVGEGDGFVNVTILRTNGITGPVSVNLSMTNGTALAGVNFVGTNTVINFSDGEFIKTISIPIIQNSTPNSDLTAYLILSNPQGGVTIAGTNVATLTILDDDMNFTFSNPAYFVDEGAGNATITVLRSSGTNGTVTVGYYTTNALPTNGVAVAGVDYGAVSGTLTFAPGETLKTFPIPIIQGTTITGPLVFQVVLRNPSVGTVLGTPNVAVVTIIDNNTGFSFASATNSVSEAGTNAVITVNRINVNTGTVSVRYATSDGTAQAGIRYLATNGILTFLDGDQSKTFLVPILNDNQVNGDQTVNLSLSSPSNHAGLVAPSNSVLTIVDDDTGFRFSSSAFTVSECGVRATISVVRSGVTNLPVTVDFSTSDGSGISGVNYFPTNGTLSFAPGETNKTFSVQVIDNSIIDGDHTVVLNLNNASTGSQIVNPSTAVLTIQECDGVQVVPAGVALISESITPTNGVIDPSETVTVLFGLRNLAGGNTTNLIATLLATNGVTNVVGAPGTNQQNYGILIQNGHSVSRAFTFKAVATNNQQITATLQLQDGSRNFGTALFSFTIGSLVKSFTNGSVIVINDSNSPPTMASPYPSVINVAGVAGNVSKITATFSNLNHTFLSDVNMLLVSPDGRKSLVISHCGGSQVAQNLTLTLDDAASASLPANSSTIVSGTYKPTSYGLLTPFPVPAPPAPYNTNLAGLIGASANGNWSLYVMDDKSLDSGAISNGWSVSIGTATGVAPSADLELTMTNTPVNSTVSNLMTYTIAVTNYGPSVATNLVLTDVLPAGAAYVTNTLNGVLGTNGVLTCTVATLAKDAGFAFTVTVVPTNLFTITNIATVTAGQSDPNIANNSATNVNTVAPDTANLGVTIASSVNPVLVGNIVVYTIVATNYGDSVATTTVVTNQIPSGLAVLGASTSRGTFTTNSGLVVFSLGDVPVSGIATMTVTNRAVAAGTNNVTVSISSAVFDPLKGNNSATVKTIIESPVILVSGSSGALVLTWPASATSYSLQGATNLNAPIIWVPMTNPPPVLSGGVYTFSVTNATNIHFFRLKSLLP